MFERNEGLASRVAGFEEELLDKLTTLVIVECRG